MLNKLILAGILMPVFISCNTQMGNMAGSKNNANQNSSHIETFIKGDTTIYFIHKLIFKSSESRKKLTMDCTYYYVPTGNSSTLNYFTFVTDDPNFKPKKMTFPLTDEKSFGVDEFDKIFAEISGKNKYSYRYSYTLPDSIFDQWASRDRPTFTLNDDLKFHSKRKNRKKLGALYHTVIFNKSME